MKKLLIALSLCVLTPMYHYAQTDQPFIRLKDSHCRELLTTYRDSFIVEMVVPPTTIYTGSINLYLCKTDEHIKNAKRNCREVISTNTDSTMQQVFQTVVHHNDMGGGLYYGVFKYRDNTQHLVHKVDTYHSSSLVLTFKP